MKIMVKRTFHQPVLILIALFRVLYVPALHTVVAVAGTFNWFRRQLLHLSYAVCFSLVADTNWLGLGSLDIFPKTECKADVMTTNNRNSLSRNVIHRIFPSLTHHNRQRDANEMQNVCKFLVITHVGN